MHDGIIYHNASGNGFDVQPGKYNFSDAGYTLSKEVVTPYCGVQHHLGEIRLAEQRYDPVN